MNWTRSKRTASSRSYRSCSIWICGKIRFLASRHPLFKGLTISPTCKSNSRDSKLYRAFVYTTYCFFFASSSSLSLRENYALRHGGQWKPVLFLSKYRCVTSEFVFVLRGFLEFDISKFMENVSWGIFEEYIVSEDNCYKTTSESFP